MRQRDRESHDRGVKVQLVYTSFGTARNERFLASLPVQDATIAALDPATEAAVLAASDRSFAAPGRPGDFRPRVRRLDAAYGVKRAFRLG